ncbi:hypothetical protein [Leeuwenhoekiella marinoflava]|uniref:Uncharacterized protein n=2 Tax=Leeuwenhoekiella marinoflava TaxID=988 RepID=A0A4Q0PQ73_9FLAO|nr:hypothetical protein [Leeuwenhoekiella marinoflava]RXG32362.1 hypothetical protein DSL99_1168 [Leeuwenhoekiella marinoflava]SHE77763.1 hypothetical protein SAMN02745246_00991 [Leeuwenhoekiella marinoflava DSM 3653]
MSDKNKKSKNDKKEHKDSIDKGPLKDKHTNQYGDTDDKPKRRGA